MSASIEEIRMKLEKVVAPHLNTQRSGLGFAVGYASPSLPDYGGVFFAGNIQSQFGLPLPLDGNTPFEIASISKTFTATLYALLIRVSRPGQKVGDYCPPNGPLPIDQTLAEITLDALVNYTSGLPQDNDYATLATPPYWPQPYSVAGLMSYLGASPPNVSDPGKEFTYSNLAFAIMSAILALSASNGSPTVHAFVSQMRERMFKPLGLTATFFDEVSLARLPLGFYYDYAQSPAYTAQRAGWPFFPAYNGAGGIVASPNDMFQWLLFNMGLVKDKNDLTSLLPVLHLPSTEIRDDRDNNLGLGWFINPKREGWAASIWKDGDIAGFNSYIAFAPSDEPGSVPSPAGAFALVNGNGITDTQTKDGTEIAAVLTNDVLLMMQDITPPADKSLYPRSSRKPDKIA
jgi:D-alanyl-D-alanine-carboxypeptidase/D-alanyl-D-alanine-endopeptidase